MKFLHLLKDTAVYWSRNRAARLSAALTYYAMASLAPMMVLLLSIVGLFFNPDRAAGLLTEPVAVAIGAENAQILHRVAQNAYNPGGNITAGIFSVLVIAVTGSELFRQLGLSLNEFWGYEPEPVELPPAKMARRVITQVLQRRLRAFLMVLGAGTLLLGSLILSTLIGLGDRMLGDFLSVPFYLYGWGNRLITLAVMSLLFALLFRYSTRNEIDWRAIWQGALVAAVLFTILQQLMSAYLVSSQMTSAYGAAASLVLILFWLYYSIQAMFFGAAWTRQVAQKD